MSSFTIAIAGKGGVGKTTVAGLLTRCLIARGCHPVLAVDADPNTGLDEVLGVRAETTIGAVREETRQIASQGMAVGVSKQELLELKIAESLVEADDFDLIAMGRPEGPGCYCYANNVLKQALGVIADSYPFVVIDNEAGLENISRRITPKVNVLVLVADPSTRGLRTLERLYELAGEMEVRYDKLAIIVNRCRRPEVSPLAHEIRSRTGAEEMMLLPDNEELAVMAEQGLPVASLPEGNAVMKLLDTLLNRLGVARRRCPADMEK